MEAIKNLFHNIAYLCNNRLGKPKEMPLTKISTNTEIGRAEKKIFSFAEMGLPMSD